MKPASVIFLIVSAVVIAAGLILCSVGANLSKEQDIPLFVSDVSVVDGNLVRSVSVDAASINRVRMHIGDADIHISASETGESYLEMYNFQVGTYDYSVQNKILLIDSETSIFSLMHIAEGNFRFNGLRHYLTYKSGGSTEKAVFLYLSDDAAINYFDISCDGGNVYVDGLSVSADYGITVKNGSLFIKDTTTASKAKLSVEKGDLCLHAFRPTVLETLVSEGNADIFFKNALRTISVIVKDGDACLGFAAEKPGTMNFAMEAGSTITYNGQTAPSNPYTTNNDPTTPPHTVSADGNVTVVFGASGPMGLTEIETSHTHKGVPVESSPVNDTTDTGNASTDA